LIPNLLVNGVPEAIKNSKAKVVYICNLMTKHGETDNFSVKSFVDEVKNYLGTMPDYVLYNNTEIEDIGLLKKYEEEKAFPVKLVGSVENTELIGMDFITSPIILRHDSNKLAKAVVKIGILNSLK